MSYTEALEKLKAHYATKDREELLKILCDMITLLDTFDLIEEVEELGL